MEEEVQAVKANKALEITKKLSKRWFIDAFTGMAQGLFATLIAGTILKTLGEIVGMTNGFGKLLTIVGMIASAMMGPGIGAGMAHYLKAPKLVVFSAIVAGFVGAYSRQIIALNLVLVNGSATFPDLAAVFIKGGPGNPIGAYVTALFAIEISTLVSGKTKLDILLVPMTSLFCAVAGAYMAFPFIWLIEQLSKGIAHATAVTPFVMGFVIAGIMGLILTLPTSSAAIWVAIAAGNNSDAMLIAGGAAVVGCACHMVGFATMSFKENGWSGVVSQGLGTSMLQIPNLMKNPRILIPPTVASIICGPIATCAFKLKCNAAGGGMGTSGLVGIIGTYKASVADGGMPWWKFILAVLFLFIILPALISYFTALLMRKYNWIKENDLKLEH